MRGRPITTTIADLKALAQSKGGQCNSLAYLTRETKYNWSCKEGHTWDTTLAVINKGSWCPKCAAPFRYQGLTLLQQLAQSKGGMVLSAEYINNDTTYEWQCKDGHRWMVTAKRVKKGSWCPTCAINLKLKNRTEDEVEQTSSYKPVPEEFFTIALSKGGKCLSSEYASQLEWQCSQGHVWKANPYNIKTSGTWCPECHRLTRTNPHALQELIDVATSKEGKCLEETYLGWRTKHRFSCKEGHIWLARPDHIKHSGVWCPYCKGFAIEDPIKLMHELAAAKNGKALDAEFKGVSANHMWECSHGHQWSARFSVIQEGKWCPECSAGRSERLVKYTLEALLKYKFDKIRPSWLINPDTGFPMELDCFNSELKLAVEYQGIQHYEIVIAFKMDATRLAIQQERDRVKRELCKQNNIILIEVPYTVSPNSFPKYLYDQISLNAPQLVNQMTHWKDIKMVEWVDKEMIITESPNERAEKRNIEKYKTYAEIASTHGGRLLSSIFLGVHTKLKWQCSKGHKWEAVPHSILKGVWCPVCNSNKDGQLEQLKSIANNNGGKLLSTVYVNNTSKLEWKCGNGHIWLKAAKDIKKGSWCSQCTTEDKLRIYEKLHPLEVIQKVALQRGGECLSPVYLGVEATHLWRCKENHEWEAKPKHVKAGSWCPVCSPTKKLTIVDVQNVAKSRGGFCKNEVYLNNATPMQWVCANGHEWKAAFGDVKKGTWCKICYHDGCDNGKNGLFTSLLN